MARKPRFNLPGVPQHVIQRGNNREPCFFAEADYIVNVWPTQRISGSDHNLL